MPVRTELFAAVTDLASPGVKPTPVSLPSSPILEDVFLIVAIGLVLTVILVLWVYVRYRGKHRQSMGRGGLITPGASSSVNGGSGGAAQAGGRRRSRRNPTLAETGGLPPVRDRESSPPAV